MTAPALVRVFAVFAAVGFAVGLPALVLCALRRVLRRRYSAAACSRLWTGLALLLCLLPVIVFGTQALPVTAGFIGTDAPVRQTADPATENGSTPAPDSTPIETREPVQTAPSPDAAAPETDAKAALPDGITLSDSGVRAARIAAVLWMAGAAAGTVHTVLHYAYWRSRCRRWEAPVPPVAAAEYAAVCTALHICRAPLLRCSGWVRAPLLTGVRRPVLFLPAEPCPQAHLRLIFTHELIHLQRRDVLRQLLLTTAGILYWYHPAVWLLAAAARRDVEQATDAAVLALNAPADSKAAAQHSAAYGEALLHSMAHARSLPLATGFAAPKKELKERMKHLFDTRPGHRGLTLTALVLCAALVCALAAGCAAGTLQVANEPDPAPVITETDAQTLPSNPQQTAENTLESTGSPTPAMTDISEPPVPSDMPALQWPVPDTRYIAEAFTGLYSHNALDIAADGGSSITAAADGTVIKAVYSTSGYGNYLLLDHGSGVTTLYAHCQELLAAVNDTVKAGDVIARVGSTGNSTGNHCHFEVRINNTQTDPQRFMTAPAEPAA